MASKIIKAIIMITIIIVFATVFSFSFDHFTKIAEAKDTISKANAALDQHTSQNTVISGQIQNLQDHIKQYQEGMYLEEIIAILAILITLSAFFIPLMSFLTLKNEKEIINEQISSLKENLKTELNTLRESLDDNIKEMKQTLEEDLDVEKNTLREEINDTSIRRNQITLQIYTTKSEYVNFRINYRSVEHVITEAQTLELKLFKLLSHDHKQILNSFSWLQSIIDPKHVRDDQEYIKNLRKTLDLVYEAGYFNNAKNKLAYNDFLDFIN